MPRGQQSAYPEVGPRLGEILWFYRWDLRPLEMKGLAKAQLWGQLSHQAWVGT